MSGLFCSSGIADEYDERSSSLSHKVTAGNVDSIESISRKISCLNSDLNGLCPEGELVIDTYIDGKQTLDEDDGDLFGFGNLKIDYKVPKETANRDSLSTREKEKRDLNRFAGVYSLRTVMSKNQDPLNIRKSNLKVDVKKKRNWAEKSNQSTISKRPMLVELHTFPGFNTDDLTPLPASLTTRNVLNIVTCAQKDLNRKPGFKKEFKRIFLAHPSQAVVQDLFWWFFLEKYQPCSEVQQQLFSRVSCNYVKLVFAPFDQKYKETFFKRFPSLVSQAVYTIFCHAFPTSYRQFDEHFKQALADVVYQWIVGHLVINSPCENKRIGGTKPVRRCWGRWPLAFLEPEGMNKEDELQKNVSKEFVVGWLVSESVDNFHEPDDIPSNNESVNWKPTKPDERLPKILEGDFVNEDPKESVQEIGNNKNDAWLRVTHERRKRSRSESVNERRDPSSNCNMKVSTSLQSTKTSNMSLKKNLKARESCHAGKGPEFQKVAFDLHGHSPLVRHFLQNKRLAKESGTSILVQRTEIDKLPPINAPTYKDIIKEALKSSHELEKQIQSLIEQSSNERIVFGREQKRQREEFRKKETEVLSRQKEVKKISDLILLQLAQGQNVESEKLITTSISNALKFDVKEPK